ncbi:MAG: CAF17-like 4Fe-4S cluster assembly/insertion protein YgfZ [Gammaproteobacteria bacterium]
MIFDQTTPEPAEIFFEMRFQHPTEYLCILPYRLIRVSGDERVQFLNRILTQNVPAQEANRIFSWAALCNPQGRVLAVFRILSQEHSVILVVERELVDMVLQNLHRYMLRSHVEITLDPDTLIGIAGHATSMLTSESSSSRALLGQDPPRGSIRRSIFIEKTVALGGSQGMQAESYWLALDFWLGIPHILAPSCGRFIPHALNLIGLDAVSLRKGCYPGQEIIARTTYRGHAKRTLVLLETSTLVSSGTPLVEASQDTETGWVLDSCACLSGEIWIQAVIEERTLEPVSDDHPVYRLVLPSGRVDDYKLIRTFKAA